MSNQDAKVKKKFHEAFSNANQKSIFEKTLFEKFFKNRKTFLHHNFFSGLSSAYV